MKMERIRKSGLLILFCLLLVSGCTRIEEKIDEILWERSGAAEEVSYQQYQELAGGNRLDADGLYRSEELEQLRMAIPVIPDGTVHVSFARSEFLKFSYYRDEALTEELPEENCWLDPGDTIYASEPELTNPNSPLYRFSKFQIREYDGSGKLKGLLAESRSVPGAVFHIPEDFSGTELSVIPFGEYRNRKVTFSAYSLQNDGSKRVLENGVWEINGITESSVPLKSSGIWKTAPGTDRDSARSPFSLPDPSYSRI